MLPAAVKDSTSTERTSGSARQLSRALSAALFVILSILLVEVLFEAWIQIQLAPIRIDDAGRAAPDLPEWPKNLKNGLYIALALLTLVKVAVERRWREFTTWADFVLPVLALIMVIAGLLGDSPLSLIGESLFVYFRGVIVFYAWRALDPPWRRVRPVLYLLGAIIVMNAVIAVIQMIFGPPAFQWFGWFDMTWANIYRVHGLLDHPNHLGHVTALTMLGLLAWFVTRPKVRLRWWLLFGLLALSLSATQSRESAIGFFLAAAVIWLMRRGALRTAVTAVVIVAVFVGAQLALRPDNRAELQRRLAGVFNAFKVGSGEEAPGACVEGNPDCTGDNTTPQREVRILFAQQGIDLWLSRPVLGYGVGQFGGIVSFKHDPDWNMDPRFVAVLGPAGFNLYGFNSQTVDSFWLHLLVETGIVGFLVYLLWLVCLALPLLPRLPRALRRRIRGPTAPGSPFSYWGIAALTFGVLVAALSPSLEDPLLPPLLFTIIGLAWVDRRKPLLAQGSSVSAEPATAASRD
jgi:O-antigen ligase